MKKKTNKLLFIVATFMLFAYSAAECFAETLKNGISLRDGYGAFVVTEDDGTDSIGIYDYWVNPGQKIKKIPIYQQDSKNPVDRYETGKTILNIIGDNETILTLEYDYSDGKYYICKYKFNESHKHEGRYDLYLFSKAESKLCGNILASPIGLLGLQITPGTFSLRLLNEFSKDSKKIATINNYSADMAVSGTLPVEEQDQCVDRMYLMTCDIISYKHEIKVTEIVFNEKGENFETNLVHSFTVDKLDYKRKPLFMDFLITRNPSAPNTNTPMFIYCNNNDKYEIYPKDLSDLSKGWEHVKTPYNTTAEFGFIQSDDTVMSSSEYAMFHTEYGFDNDGILKVKQSTGGINYKITSENFTVDTVNIDPLTSNLLGVIYGSPPVEYIEEKDRKGKESSIEYASHQSSSAQTEWEKDISSGIDHSVDKSAGFIVSFSSTFSAMKNLSHDLVKESQSLAIADTYQKKIYSDYNLDNENIGLMIFASPSNETDLTKYKVIPQGMDSLPNKLNFTGYDVNNLNYYTKEFNMLNPEKDDLGTGKSNLLAGMAPAPGGTYDPHKWYESKHTIDFKNIPSQTYTKSMLWNDSGEQKHEFSIGEISNTGRGTATETYSNILGFAKGEFTQTMSSTESWLKQSFAMEWVADNSKQKSTNPYDLSVWYIESPNDLNDINKYGVWIPDYYKEKGDKPWCYTYTTHPINTHNNFI